MGGGVSFSRFALVGRGTPHHKRRNRSSGLVPNAMEGRGTPYANHSGGGRSSFPAAGHTPSSQVKSRYVGSTYSQTPQSLVRRRRLSTAGNTPSSLDGRRINFESARKRAVSPGTKQQIVNSMQNDALFGPPPSSGRKR